MNEVTYLYSARFDWQRFRSWHQLPNDTKLKSNIFNNNNIMYIGKYQKVKYIIRVRQSNRASQNALLIKLKWQVQ